MGNTIKGKVIEIYQPQQVTQKFKKQEFVVATVETNGGYEFTDYVKTQVTNERCDLLNDVQIGDEVTVSYNLRGRKWEKDGEYVYFTNIEAWKIEKKAAAQVTNDSQETFEEPPY